MSRTLLHDWENSIEKNKNNTEELLKIAEDIYNTAYARGKASEERTNGEWRCVTCKYRDCEITEKPCRECSRSWSDLYYEEADMKGGAE